MCSSSRLFSRRQRGSFWFSSLSPRWLSALALLLFFTSVLHLNNYVSTWPPTPHDPDLGIPGPNPTDPHPLKPTPSDDSDMLGSPNASMPAVALRQGRYVGSTILSSSYFPRPLDAFRGIPYAQTTAGENRFRLPKPLPPSEGRFDALRFGKTCPRDGFLRPEMGEDCLNLNIYRTAGLVDNDGLHISDKSKVLLPVIVYVHGGAFNTGTGIERNMASFVSWAEDPMIAINFNYRVGPLGFLPSDLTAREGLLNLGLKDQQLLFDWVQQNIEAFGGDPSNVTIMGLSAGAHSVCSPRPISIVLRLTGVQVGHHLMYYANGSNPAPFAKAILESGATTARAVFYPTHPRHLIQFQEFLAAAGVASAPDEEVFNQLRQLPLSEIVRASKIVWDKYTHSVTWPFQPVIDGPNPHANSSLPRANSSTPIIPILPIDSWHQGHHLRIPVLTGYNTNEGTIFIPHSADVNEEFRAFFQGLIPTMSAADVDALDRLYPDPVTDPSSPYRDVPHGKGRQFSRLDAAYSHYAYICPVLQTAHFLSTDSQNKAPVYVYRYAATGAFGTANHGDEAPVVAHDMNFLGCENLPGLKNVSDAMHGAWARFVVSKTGSPNHATRDDVVTWPVFKSPFVQQQADEAWRGAVKRGETLPAEIGEKLVFGEGNDERMSIATPMIEWIGKRSGNKVASVGTPAKIEVLTDVEIAACRFWWGRVELSEGLGTAKETKVRGRTRL